MQGWRKRLQDVIKGTPGLNMTIVSKRAGKNAGYLSEMFKDGVVPTVDVFVALAEAAGVSPAWLLQGEEQGSIKIPVIGVISGAETWRPLDGQKVDPVGVEIHDYDMIGVEVRGDSMAPVYRDQDFLIGQRRAGRFGSNLIGSDCIISTRDGRHYVKILGRGTRQGLFSLRSYNPAVKDVENVSLDWVAPIVWIRRGGR